MSSTDDNQMKMMLTMQGTKTWAIIATVLAFISLCVAIAAIVLTSMQGFRASASIAAQAPQIAAVAPAPSLAPAQLPVAAPITTPPAQAAQTASQVQSASTLAPPTVAAGADGMMYSHDAQTGQFFSMNRNGELASIAAESIPADVLSRLLQQAPATADNVPSLEAVTNTARAAIAADATDELAINQLLAKPEVAAGIIEGVAGLASITIPGDARPDKPIYIFMDPRCPHCHNLFRQLDGRVETVWIPTLALGDSPGAPQMMGTIMGEVAVGRDASGKITSSSFVDDPQRAVRLEAQLRGENFARTATGLSQDQDDILSQNVSVMAQLYGPQRHLAGVPTVILQKPDGSAELFNGYSPEVVEAILATVADQRG